MALTAFQALAPRDPQKPGANCLGVKFAAQRAANLTPRHFLNLQFFLLIFFHAAALFAVEAVAVVVAGARTVGQSLRF